MNFFVTRILPVSAFLFFTTLAASGRDKMQLWLPKIFSDDMVLQQGKPVPVWGTAAPFVNIEVSIANIHIRTCAAYDGKWIAYLPEMEYGGPYEMMIIARDTVSFSNVMIGEVWFASGQSNMNFSIGRPVDNSEQVIAEANFPNIREFSVPGRTSSEPSADLPGGRWKVCNPANVKQFSAVAYFFAQHLHLDKKVAVGIIHSSFSGTPIESWISADYLGMIPYFRDTVQTIQKEKPDWAAMDQASRKLDSLRDVITATANNGMKQKVFANDYDDSEWRSFDYPLRASRMNIPGYALVWARKTIELKSRSKTDLYLDLGTVTESEITYFNGVEIGRTKLSGKRTYRVPAGIIKKGKNVITIRFSNEWNNGRIGNDDEHPSLHSEDNSVKISLGGKWRFNEKIEPELPVAKVIYIRAPTGLFNAMVSPVTPFAIKGFLWYQGEGNAGNAPLYKELFPALVTDWRIHWKQGELPFLFVQLPNYKAGWAQIREAQASLLKYPKTGMAVTIDVGDPNELHPGNKKPVGERLYQVAKRVAYNDTAIVLFPKPKEYQVADNSIYLSFDEVGQRLMTADSKAIRGFTIAGKDQQFHPAAAEFIDKCTIKIHSAEVTEPKALRYAWEGNPNCNLCNSEGLPCAPFRTDTWEK